MSFLETVKEKLQKRKTPMQIPRLSVEQALRKIKNPKASTDILESGVIQNITTTANSVTINIAPNSELSSSFPLLKDQIEKEVWRLSGVQKINIVLPKESIAQNEPGSAKATESPLAKIKNIIAVASGKGGVGKSTTAVNLAFALQSHGYQVGLLDADIYGPSIPLMTKAPPPQAMKDNLVIPPTVNGIKIISIGMFSSQNKAAILRGPMVAQLIRQFLLQVAWETLDFLIIDYPPGTGDIQLTLSQIAPIAGAIIVTTPQEVALSDVRKAMAMFDTTKVPILGVVETMSYFECDQCSKKHFIFNEGGGEKLAKEFGTPLLAQIPLDQQISRCSDSGSPIIQKFPELSSAKAFNDAAKAVAEQINKLKNAEHALDHFELIWK